MTSESFPPPVPAAEQPRSACPAGPAAGTAPDNDVPVGAELAARWLRALHETPQLFSGLLDADGVLVHANRLAVEGCGLVRADTVGRPFWNGGWWAGRPELRQQVRGWCEQVARDGRPLRRVTPFLLGDGSQRVLDLALAPMTDQTGRVTHLVVTGSDITDAVTAQQERQLRTELKADADTAHRVAQDRAHDLERLQATEVELARALQLADKVLGNVGDGIYGLDRDGRAEFVNPAAAQLTGYPVADLLGQDLHALLHSQHPDGSPYPRSSCPTWQARLTGRTVTAPDEVFWRADGTALPVSIVAVPIVEGEVVTGLVVSFRDITAQRELARQRELLAQVTEREAAQRALADQLQRALLTPPPQPDHLHLVTRYRSAASGAQVGGDWYDAFLQPDGETMLVIGDVVGHDSTAAAKMGQLRGVLRTLAYNHSIDGPAAILGRVERTARGLSVDALATVVLARIERLPDVPVTGTRTLRWSNAGHLPPVLLHPDGCSTLLDSPADLLLGVDPDTPRGDHSAEFPDHSTLLLFTDGLVERRDASLDDGLHQLQAALSDLGRAPLPELCDTVLARMTPHAGDDDIALLAVRAYPDDQPHPASAGPYRPRGPDLKPHP